MAAKTKAAAMKKAALKKPAARAKKTAAVKQRFAVKLLTELPPLDERRRRVFRSAFSDEQCRAWGDTTKATSVLAEAERFIGQLHAALKKGVPTGYSLNRLTWLTSLVNELHDAVDADQASQNSAGRTERTGAIELADKTRRKLANALIAASTGSKAFRKEVTERNESNRAAHALESSLAGLLQLAVRLRMSDDGEALADETGLTETFLSSVSAVTDGLRSANEATYTSEGGHDSTTTNAVEGRVLRELAFAVSTFRRSREDGESTAALRVGPLIARVMRTQDDSEAKSDDALVKSDDSNASPHQAAPTFAETALTPLSSSSELTSEAPSLG
jgi:hypothetical protein